MKKPNAAGTLQHLDVMRTLPGKHQGEWLTGGRHHAREY
jgi:hypothetical protein